MYYIGHFNRHPSNFCVTQTSGTLGGADWSCEGCLNVSMLTALWPSWSFKYFTSSIRPFQWSNQSNIEVSELGKWEKNSTTLSCHIRHLVLCLISLMNFALVKLKGSDEGCADQWDPHSSPTPSSCLIYKALKLPSQFICQHATWAL